MYNKNQDWLRYDITCFNCHNFWQDADPYPAICPRCGKNPAPRSYKDFIFDELIKAKGVNYKPYANNQETLQDD